MNYESQKLSKHYTDKNLQTVDISKERVTILSFKNDLIGTRSNFQYLILEEYVLWVQLKWKLNSNS